MRDCDVALVLEVCHSLKGSSAIVGAVRMAQLCEELEAAMVAPGVSGANGILEHLASEFDRIRPALDAAFATRSG